MDKTKIVEALASVKDPVSGQDLISMNRVRDLKVEGSNISFTLEFPSMNIPSKSELNFACIAAVQGVYPNSEVNVHFMAHNPSAAPATNATPQVKNIIAVASGKGGVGKSTVAVNLALGLQQRGARVGLIDADLYGPSIPTMLGLQGKRPAVKEVYGKHKLVPLDAFGMPVISIGFIVEPQQAVVLRGPRLAGIIKQFFQDCLWPDLDFIVVDLPPGTGDIQLTLVQTVPVTGAVLVTTPQQVAIDDAIKAANMFQLASVNVPILGVVENMSWFTPEELPDNKYFLFGEGGGKTLAKEFKTALLGQLPIVQGVRESGDAGSPVILKQGNPAAKPYSDMVANVLQQLQLRHQTLDPTKVVDVKL